jgi:hypothetical protein
MKRFILLSLFAIGCAKQPATETMNFTGNPEVDVILRNFSEDEISDMFMQIPLSDERPESVKNLHLLFEARKFLRESKEDVSKSDAVNDRLRNLK